MPDPINLRQFRKRKQRQEKADKAEANRKRHAISSVARRQARENTNADVHRLDGKKLPRDK